MHGFLHIENKMQHCHAVDIVICAYKTSAKHICMVKLNKYDTTLEISNVV